MICVSLRAGGSERIVARIANHLCCRYAVTIVLLSRTEPFYPVDPGVSLIRPDLKNRSEAGLPWYPRIVSHLWAELDKAAPDLVFCFGEAIAPIVIPLAWLQGRGVFVFNRASPLTSLRGLRGVINPLTYPLADRVVVQTERSTRIMRHRFRFSRFEVLPNPIDRPQNVQPVDQRKSRIINVGTLGGKKNQQALLRIFAGIDSSAGWSLDLVGDGPDRQSLEKSTNQLSLKRSVRFLGQRGDVNDLLQDSPIFAFTSLTEGFPNALAEAMAAGCACISYDCPTGPSELIEHGVNGFLVEPGDEAEYIRLLQRLIDSPDLRAEFSRNARESMKRFEAGVVMERLERMIEEVTEEAQGTRRKVQGKP